MVFIVGKMRVCGAYLNQGEKDNSDLDQYHISMF